MGSPAGTNFGHETVESRCGGCRLADQCAAAPAADDAPFSGASLVGASLFYFLVPALMGLLGAALAQGGAVAQLLGGAGGLLLGMLLTSIAARLHAAYDSREECFEPR